MWEVSSKIQLLRSMRGRSPHISSDAVVWAINRAPAKLVALWEEEQTRSSSICSANSYDKRIATSESSYGGIGFTALFYAWVNSKAKAVSDGTTNPKACVWAAFCVKECDGTHSECCARGVPIAPC